MNHRGDKQGNATYSGACTRVHSAAGSGTGCSHTLCLCGTHPGAKRRTTQSQIHKRKCLQLRFQGHFRQVRKETKRDMKSLPICGALIGRREGVSTPWGGRPLLDRTALTAPTPKPGHLNLPLTYPHPTRLLPLTESSSRTLVCHTLDKPSAKLHNSGFSSKRVKSLIIICLNCINNPPGFNRIFL